MSRNSYKNQRRSALSFAGGDDSLDSYIDNIVESDPWKNVEEIEKSEAAHIQNMLNEFDNIISQQKTAKAGHSGTKRKSKQPTQNSTPKSTENIVESNSTNAIEIEKNDSARIQNVLNDFDDKIPQQKTSKAGHSGTRRKSTQATEKSAITDSTTINFEESSNMQSNISIPKSKDQTRKKPSPKQAPKTVEKMSLSELQHNVDDANRASQKASEPNVNEMAVNKSVKEVDKKDVTNTNMNLLTSTPKIKVPKTKGEMAKNGKSIVRKRKSKITDSEIKPEKNVNCEEKKRRKRTPKKNAKEIEHCQGEDNKTIPVKEENILNMKEQKNNLECNKENDNTLKSEAKQKKVKSKSNGETKLHKNKKICNAVDGKCEDKSKKDMNIGNKLEKGVKNKLPKGVTSNKSPKLKNNVENTESQCKKDCAKNCGKYEQRLLKAREKSEERKDHKKSKKAAKAMAKLSCQMSIVQKKMESIKIDLENSESSTSSSDYSDDSYSSSYSSSSSGSSHSSDCSCSDCYYYYTSDDYTDYTYSSNSSTYSENNEYKSKSKSSESKISR